MRQDLAVSIKLMLKPFPEQVYQMFPYFKLSLIFMNMQKRDHFRIVYDHLMKGLVKLFH